MIQQSTCRVGIDIGGTKINIGLVTEDGSILASTRLPSTGARETAAFVDRITTALEALLASQGMRLAQVVQIGVGIPGTVDTQHGIVLFSSNLFGDQPVPLGEAFAQRLGRPVTVVQDSWAAAWAEQCFGAGKPYDSHLCLTIGTGIGCGVILHRRVYAGPMHAAGELGHMPIVWQGRPCSCGKKGCLETYASGTAIRAQALERFPEKLQGSDTRTETIFDMAKAGDADARALIEDCVDKLAYGIALGLDLFSVDTVLLSGGVSVHRELVIDPLEEKVLQYGYPAWSSRHHLRIMPAALGPDAPMVGAAFLTAAEMQF